jgi:hypothetical protein
MSTANEEAATGFRVLDSIDLTSRVTSGIWFYSIWFSSLINFSLKHPLASAAS